MKLNRKTFCQTLLPALMAFVPADGIAQSPIVAVPVTNTVRIIRPAGVPMGGNAVRPGPGQFAPVPKPVAPQAPGPFLQGADAMAPITPGGGGTAAIGAPRAARKAETAAEALKEVESVLARDADLGRSGPRVHSLVPPEKDLVIDAGGVNFPGMPVDQILELYGEWTGRTMLIGQGVNKQLTLDIVSNEDLKTSEVIEAFDIILNQNQISVVPVGDKFLLAVGSAQAIKEGMPFSDISPERMPESPALLTKIIQLKYAEPKDVVNVIQKFAKVAGGITAVESTKTLIIQEFAINLKRMLELVAKIDVPAPANEQVFEVIPILYAPVSEVADMLGNFTEGGSAFGSARTTGSGSRSSGAGGSRNTTSSRSGSSNSSFNSNNRNSTSFRPQQNAPPQPVSTPGTAASSFQQRLRSIVANAAGEEDPEPLLGKARIGYYERSNSLLVRGTRDELIKVKELVKQLDIVQPQVLIEGIIMDVSLTDNFQFGINLLQKQTGLGGNSTVAGGVNNAAGGFLSSFTGTNSLSSAISTMGGGFSYYGLLGNSWEAVLRAVETDSFATILQRPQILTTHAEPARLFVGETLPFPSSSGADFSGISRVSIQSVDIGITLDILPLINPDGLVILEIEQSIESFRGFETFGELRAPRTTRRDASSKIAVNSGETIILGGMITNTKDHNDTGTPFLRSIPILGNLFKQKTKNSLRSELIVMLRPTVLKTPELAQISSENARQQLPGVRRAELEIKQEEAVWLDRIAEDERKLLEKNAATAKAASMGGMNRVETMPAGQVQPQTQTRPAQELAPASVPATPANNTPAAPAAKGKWDLPIDMFEVLGGK
ncbi:MAG: hypothetical protein ISQ14_06675 [Verrucomicrobiae bacterium]|nr:hypothetical protein [Verrucomicrobiae bacterium]